MSNDGKRVLEGLGEALRHAELCQPLAHGACPTCGLVIHEPPVWWPIPPTMVERVAVAIFATTNAIPGDWASYSEETRGRFRDHARAAIEIMREPTGPMIAAAGNTVVAMWKGTATTIVDDPTPLWHAMIDSALK